MRLQMLLCFLLLATAVQSQKPFVAGRDYNLDESKVPPYTLPDPLQMKDGKILGSVEQWNNIQRPYIYHLFEENVYGRLPTRTLHPWYKLMSIDSSAFSGMAIRKQVRVGFSRTDSSIYMDILVYLPHVKGGPVPVFAGLNFYGNQTVSREPGVPVTRRWAMEGEGIVNGQATEASRGSQASQWDVLAILKMGYGLATVYDGDLEPDNADGWKTGIRTALKDSLQIQPAEWCAMGAWAWGLSRLMDYLEQDPAVNAKKVALMGHSRLGKAALWAAASDQRFSLVISNESGEGGAALSKRDFGETIQIINTNFPHWFVAKYKDYNGKSAALPLDQHMLLSLIAPRPLYVASAAGDQWSDPRGEFLSAWHAGKVYRLFHENGLGTDTMPGNNQPVGDFIRYHIRDGKHDVTAYDWNQYIEFAQRHFNSK
jgi:hypothetical protein